MSVYKWIVTIITFFVFGCASVERHPRIQNPPSRQTSEPKPKQPVKPVTSINIPSTPQPVTSGGSVNWLDQAKDLEKQGRWQELFEMTSEKFAQNPTANPEAKVFATKAITNLFATGKIAPVPRGLSKELELEWRWAKAQSHLAKSELSEAEEELESYLDLSSEPSPRMQEAQALLLQIEGVKKVDTRAVGVVLPLSGKNAVIGQKTLRGVQIGFGLDQEDERGLRLVIRDDEGLPESAKAAVDSLITTGQVVGIIGSVTSKTALAVAERARDFKVPVVSLAQRQGITEVGETIFRNSLTAEMQVSRILDFAMTERKMRRFAILFPNDSYGTEFSNVFWDQVLVRGGEIVAAQTYEASETDFRKPIRALLGQHRTDMRLNEYRDIQNSLKQRGIKKNSRSNLAEDDLPPIINFDAIFIPDSTKALGQISAMLAFNDAGRVTLLGTNLWNQTSLSKRLGRWGGEVYFVDSPKLTIENPFYLQYSKLFGEPPGPLEILGFEAGYLMRMSLLSGVRSRAELSQKMSTQTALPMNPFREVTRPLQVLTLSKSGTVEAISE